MGLNNPGGYKGVVKPVCLVLNGSFETGDLTNYVCIKAQDNGTCSVQFEDGKHYCRISSVR